MTKPTFSYGRKGNDMTKSEILKQWAKRNGIKLKNLGPKMQFKTPSTWYDVVEGKTCQTLLPKALIDELQAYDRQAKELGKVGLWFWE
jgi:hypothetical protein